MNPRDLVLTPAGVRFMGRHIPATIGLGGISKAKREGDGATPTGTHRIVGMLYRPDRVAKPASWAVPIGFNDLWCDDPGHEDYNLMVSAPFAAGHETLRRSDPMYDVILITDWNWPFARKHHGSAIFLHQWRRRCAPTQGCVAFSRADLLWICARLTHESKLIVA